MIKNDEINIFVVDDDVEVGTILSLLLRGEGFVVDKFMSGKNALSSISFKIPDLILLDYMLPGENVEELIPQFRKKGRKDLPIILMSASSDAPRAARKFGIKDFLAKPFSRDEVIYAIKKIVV